MNRSLFSVLVLAACGGSAQPAPTPPVATVAPVVQDAAAPVAVVADASAPAAPAAVTMKVTMTGQVALHVSSHLEGPAFTSDGARVAVVVDGKLQLFEASTLALVTFPGGKITRASRPLLVVGDHAFDPATGAELIMAIPKPFECQGTSFSQDGARMASYCWAASKDGVLVYDTHTGAQLGTFREFETAAPVRVGSLTASGNFIFWQARASGAFEEIKSHVTGPVMSSHSVMSPDERFLFTAPDRNWYTEAVPTGQLIDPSNGHTLMNITGNVETATFSPSSRMLAVFRNKRTDSSMVPLPITLHSTTHDGVLATLPDAEATSIAFSPDDTRLATVTATHALRVYKLEP